MQKVQTHKVGLVLGASLGVFHLIWALLVASGTAQSMMDFVFKLHMINPPYTIASFSFGLALTLIIVTAVIGYIAGLIIGYLWNKLVA